MSSAPPIPAQARTSTGMAARSGASGRPGRSGRLRPAVLVALVTMALALQSFPAQAAFPGVNDQIAFTTDRDGNQEIYGMAFDGSAQVDLTSNAAADYQPAASPDGSKLAFVSERDGNPEIYVMNADGSNAKRLTNDPAADLDPAWSADGTRIYFDADPDGNQDVYSMKADGSDVQRLTTDPAKDYQPAAAPDGSRIAFVSERDNNPEIYTMKPDGSGVQRLTNNSAADSLPDWSPDAQSLVFASDRDGNLEVYSMKADGSSQTNLTTDPAADSNPSYAPGGNWILFDSDRTKNVDVWAVPVQRARSAGAGPAGGGGGGPNPVDLTKAAKSSDGDATQGALTPMVALDRDLKAAIAGVGKVPHHRTHAQVQAAQADLTALIASFPPVGDVPFGKVFGQLSRSSGSLNAVLRSSDPLGKSRANTTARLQKTLAAAKGLAGEAGLGTDVTKAFNDIATGLQKVVTSLGGNVKERSFLRSVHDLRTSFQNALALFPAVQHATFTSLLASLQALSRSLHQALTLGVKNKKFVGKVKADLATALGIEQRLQGQLNAAARP